jgi:hypothetical protein
LYRVLPAGDQQALVLPFAILFNTVWFLAMWSYVRANQADPGVVPRRWQEFVRKFECI